MSITKASLSVMIFEFMLRYSLFTTRPCFTRKAIPPRAPAERSFFYCIITLNSEIVFFMNVSFRPTVSKLLSLRYNSCSFGFDLIPWKFQNKIFVPTKANIRYLS